MFTGQKNRLLSFVLEKEFTERVGEEKKAPGSTQQCLWRKERGRIPGASNTDASISDEQGQHQGGSKLPWPKERFDVVLEKN